MTDSSQAAPSDKAADPFSAFTFAPKFEDPTRFFSSLQPYVVDALQRSALLMDVLRQRGDEQAQMTSRPLATVLTFDHEILMSGAALRKPINYALSRVIPPADAKIDPAKRPVVIVDPRAGQGPGIGGFHAASEIGDAFAAGHPVYFIGFSAEPEPDQTFFDVVEGQVAFFERIAELHPNSPRPLAVGNCQAGYQTLMVAMLRPDLFGPVLMPGSPISYWQGVHGKNPMRYAGGLFGGSWLTELTSDLGHGKFDGAYLISNFDNLNPANTLFGKLYNVYKNVDTEGPRFLGFEKWWGDFILMNGAEIQYLVDKHFIGDKLARGEIATEDGRRFDIRNVTSPIIVFTSLGDNISPPQQTLGWILDIYESVDDIRAQGKVIVYCIDPKVGHLAIFVSPKVALREHQAFMQTMDIIDVLPPGLYEMVVTPKQEGEAGADLVDSEFLARFETRTLDDIRAFGRNSAEDDRAFAAVERVSEINRAMYKAVLQPLIRSLASEQAAAAMRAMNPVRAQYTLFASDKPWMAQVAGAAERVRAARAPAAPDNPFLLMQEQAAQAITAFWDGFRDTRDQFEEKLFYAIYGSPLVQAMVGVSDDNVRPQRAKTPGEREAIAQTMARYRADIDKGGPFEAMLRAVMFVLAAERSLDERSAFALGRIASKRADMTEADLKAKVRHQFFALQLDPEHALRSLLVMAPDAASRKTVLGEVRAVVAAAGVPHPETARRIGVLEQILATPAPRAVEASAAPVIEAPAKKLGAPVSPKD
ncbi:hypothetical protein M2323_002410 [Rhodoblastus acidophilus]|uniref:DUF3141 domain-containing protein n=1 Tax=Rhodoblastus acidophilus TaxID=1074 RepID=UPI0022256AC0|nr:DUF3141 domain-containing protein [Rhodoblastus acidophilus]MCW2284523.1 hypothetical protein [Rhodoblastus acidophilus]MCW2333476.1 hypothetical protein [Rhodoblastus acidophilus]